MLQRSSLPQNIAVLVFLLLFIAGWPYYKYIFDSDAIGYLTIAKHYAAGRWHEAVNGYWSPLHSWLAAPFVSAGFYELYVFKVLNAGIGVLILLTFHRYLKRYEFSLSITWGLMLAAVIIVLHFAYFEVAADILLVLLLLLYFLVITTNNFTTNLKLNILAGCLAAIAYFSKTYAFPFLLLHFTFVHWLAPAQQPRNWLVGISVFLLVCFPWILALHDKYGIWTIGTSGKMNSSVYLVHEYNPNLLLFAPPYENSVAWWEDAYLYQKKFYTPFQSAALFVHQIRILLFNIQQYFLALSVISYLVPFTFLLLFFDALQKNSTIARHLTIFSLLLPLGYLFIHIETRFLWILALLLLPWIVQWWIQVLKNNNAPKWIYKTILAVVVVSFLAEPVNQLKDNINKQKNWSLQARALQAGGITGNCISHNKHLDEGMIVAYQAGLRYFMPGFQKDLLQDVLPEAIKSNIRWFLFFYDTEEKKKEFLQSEIGKSLPAPALLHQGMLVFDLSKWMRPAL